VARPAHAPPHLVTCTPDRIARRHPDHSIRIPETGPQRFDLRQAPDLRHIEIIFGFQGTRIT
jgi:hypothetical protein